MRRVFGGIAAAMILFVPGEVTAQVPKTPAAAEASLRAEILTNPRFAAFAEISDTGAFHRDHVACRPGGSHECLIDDGVGRYVIKAFRLHADTTADSLVVGVTMFENAKSDIDASVSMRVLYSSWVYHYVNGRWIKGLPYLSNGS